MKKLWRKLATLAAAVVAAFAVVPGITIASADDAQTTTTSVMQDLKSDATFNVDDYPSKTIDELKTAEEEYLQVIRIGESVNNELYIYVYQPSDSTKEIEAAKVSISRTVIPEGIDEDKPTDDTRVYELKLVSTEGVFDKYLVKDFKVFSSFSVRNYSIIALFRESDKELGDDMRASDVGGITTFVAVRVARIYYARTTAGGSIEYAFTTDDVIVVTDKFHGFIRYSDGFKFLERPYTDSHFIAFTTDHKIDELLSAEVYYETRAYEYMEKFKPDNKYESTTILRDEFLKKDTVKLLEGDKGSNEADGWLASGHKYEWERIETLSEFRDAEESALTSDTISGLLRVENAANGNAVWVLRFMETSYTEDHKISSYYGTIYTQSITYKTTRVSNVAILKLTFRTAGVPHTMNVVDHMVTPDEVPDGEHGLVEGIQRNYDDWLASINSWLVEMQKTLRSIGVAIGAVFAAVLLGFCVYGIVTLVNWIRDSVHRRRGGG